MSLAYWLHIERLAKRRGIPKQNLRAIQRLVTGEK